MFAIVITGPDDFHERHTFALDEISIGRAPINDLVLDHPSIANFHATLLSDARGFRISSPRQQDAPIWINGRLTTGDTLARGDQVRLGELVLVVEVLRVEASSASGETENGLIRSIETERDVVSREVYADWLEEHGQPARAEFVRLQLRAVQLAGDSLHAFEQAQVRLRELATGVDAQWRIRIACPQIEACGHIACPGHWGALEPTESATVRRCGHCKTDVHYCFSTGDARLARRQQMRVVSDLRFDAAEYREEAGRVPRCAVCGLDFRWIPRVQGQTCVRCGALVE